MNTIALFLGTMVVAYLALGLLWRVGSWQIRPAASLTLDEGLRLGSAAPEIAAHLGEHDMHLSFAGRPTFLVFGSRACEPCKSLVVAASKHPATRPMRRVYIGDSELVDVDTDYLYDWELYRFHDEAKARNLWRAPVSPYFYAINADGRIVAKGVANHPDHLDRLLTLAPSVAQMATM
ncbi:MAG: hypothetical protein MSC30_11110 [Gaiellaceae bacterium MAG52_C11]|nr:hypothetical protein [Candidatus Gaiellasilicea maunaloa]